MHFEVATCWISLDLGKVRSEAADKLREASPFTDSLEFGVCDNPGNIFPLAQ